MNPLFTFELATQRQRALHRPSRPDRQPGHLQGRRRGLRRDGTIFRAAPDSELS